MFVCFQQVYMMYIIVVLKLQVVEASSLSWGTRIKGFIACFALGILCSVLVRFPPTHCLCPVLSCSLPFGPVTFLYDTSLNGVDKWGGRQGGQLCGSGGRRSTMLTCTCPLLPFRGLFCCGCPGRVSASLQCFTPWVTSHQSGGNHFLFSLLQPCCLLNNKISIVFEGGREKDAPCF